MNIDENPTPSAMADLEQTPGVTIDNPVALTQVGKPDHVEEQQHDDTKTHDQAVDIEQGDIAQAATAAPQGEDVDMQTARSTVDAPVQEFVAAEKVEEAVPPTEDTTNQMIEATDEELASHVDLEQQETKEAVTEQEDTGAAATTTEAQALPQTDLAPEPTEEGNVDETPAKSEPQSDVDADDLFGSDDDDLKHTSTFRFRFLRDFA